jgi:hypothetical protein
MNNSSLARARTALLVEHATLRQLIGESRELLSRRQRGDRVEGQLATLMARLDRAFEEHNVNEEAVLVSLLPSAAVAAEHTQEHRDLRVLLREDDAVVLVDALHSLETHLDSEELHFLSVTAR